MASDLANSYEQAASLANEQESAAVTKDYFRNVLLPYYSQRYTPVLQSCFAAVPQPDSRPFSFVAAIGEDGRVVRLYNDQETNIFACLRESVEQDVFPSPPLAPYYLHIDMQFEGKAVGEQSSSADQQSSSLGDAARRLRAERAEQASTMAAPDWATGQPKVNNEAVSAAQVIGWVAGGVPSEAVIAALKERGVTFSPREEVKGILGVAGADSAVLEAVSNAQQTSSSESDPEELGRLATILTAVKQQETRRAIRDTVALLKTNSKNPGLYVLLGHLSRQQENWSGMAAAYYAATRLDRDFAYSHGELSFACYKMQQGCALREAKTMLELDPRSSDGHKYLGMADEMRGDFSSAMEEYRTALSLGSRAPHFIYYDMGRAKVMSHDLQGAIAPFRRSIEVKPDFADGFAALGDTYFDLGNVEKALVNFREAKRLAPERLDVRQNIGATLCDSGQYAEAITEFDELLQMDPDWNMARPCLIKALRAMGRNDEANKVRDEYYRREKEQ